MITTIKEWKMNESLSKDDLNFNEQQLINGKNFFKELFDWYLKESSPTSYPMLYHNTDFNNYESIMKNGLINDRNYFFTYNPGTGLYIDDDEPGISCIINYKDVIDRLYPDPEHLMLLDLGYYDHNLGNASTFKQKGIDERILYCLVIRDILKLDLNKKLLIKDINPNILHDIIELDIFQWVYVKGEINPNLINIKIDPTFKKEKKNK